MEVELGGAALQHREEEHGGLALHPRQGESTRGRRASVSQLVKEETDVRDVRGRVYSLNVFSVGRHETVTSLDVT